MIFKNCTFYNEFFEKEFGDIEVENGIIKQIGILGDGRDMSGLTLIPGFVDIHIHGCGGGDSSDADSESLDKMTAELAKHGVTSFCPTAMTLPVERLIKIADVIASYKSKGSKIVGINFEGPFIAESKKGAQNGDYIIAGNIKDVDDLYDASAGLMKLITIAPEAFDSDEFIESVSGFCTVSIGHSAADAKTCQRAVDLGITHATHLYNAMTPMTHREAGIVGTVLDNDRVTCELICDGGHICPAVIRNTFKVLGEDRAVVVSDSMRAAGLGEGEFELGGQQVFVKPNGKYAVLEDGTIAASITNIYEEFKNLIEFGIDFKTALKACTINPARVINEDDKIGSIQTGKQADFVFVNENLEIKEVYINGILA
ncbi:MAG: N-acetylglucosamine-6-phosphate deacetylase [Acetobacter sp.]|nr:N-acetylglucosamine-6-phosphate deacetylase [Bacteroides sp.]MCM1341074.1 N-acetylglucosamine-6-phosphate deacetylase [Acetobacter sp.]MCM1433593.1 N-acetylglucosamine-6-phosphate deacetylase [Clostridiales bacterium]